VAVVTVPDEPLTLDHLRAIYPAGAYYGFLQDGTERHVVVGHTLAELAGKLAKAGGGDD
jgi:hypothetical protein